MDSVITASHPRVDEVLVATHLRLERLVAQAEAAARAFYRRTLGREATIGAVLDEVFAAVAAEGDEAVARYSRQFDGSSLPPDRLLVPKAELARAHAALPASLRAAMDTAISQVTAYQRALMPRDIAVGGGTELGVRWTPLERIGAYVPGGTAGSLPLFSSVIMNLVPAAVAGVRETVLATPPRADGSIAPELLAAAHAVGCQEVWAVGGMVAIAALACGTPRLRAVDKIVGPGNIYVTLAKRRAYGRVDIDMLAGPSEILVIADGAADPRHAAADLLSQAEHDPLAMAVCLALEGNGEAIRAEVQVQLARLPAERQATARASLANFGMIIACNPAEAERLANRMAPEHCELLVRDPASWIPRIRHAGAIFAGPWSPEPIGDYVAGPSHTLPTGGTARMWSGIAVDTFLRRTSLIQLTRQGFERLAQAGLTLARGEGLEAHARAIEARLDRT
jgi:histidinol dehydrogenase